MADGRGRGGDVGDCDVTAVISVGVAVTDIVIVVVAVVVTSFVVAAFVSTKSLTSGETLVTDGTLVHLSGGGDS